MQGAAEVLIASFADGGEVEVVDLGGGVCALVPGVVVAVAEDDDVGEVVVVVDDEGEVAHGFVAFVHRDGEGDVGVGVESVLGDEVGVFPP